MPTKKQPIPVTREVVCGEVKLSDDGTTPALHRAFEIIAEHEADHPEGGTYRFLHMHVNVTHDDASMVEVLDWLRDSGWAHVADDFERSRRNV